MSGEEKLGAALLGRDWQSHGHHFADFPYRRSGELYVQIPYPGSKNQTNDRTRREGVGTRASRLLEGCTLVMRGTGMSKEVRACAEGWRERRMAHYDMAPYCRAGL